MIGRRIITWVGLLLLVLGVPGLCAAQGGVTLIVPDDYETIQSAIENAGDGDVVLIRSGIYRGAGNVNLDPGGKRIIIKSVSGPANTVIDCEGTSRGFIIHNSEQATTIIAGLTIKNGYVAEETEIDPGTGGAIRISSASPTINNCVFFQNKAEMGGGAIHIEMGSPIISNCEIDENSALAGGGGGIYCDSYSSPTIIGSFIRRNSAPNGGGIACSWMATPVIRDCIISGNTAEMNGGGIACYEAYPRIINSTISRNSVSGSTGGGGGIAFSSYSNPTIVNCVITKNEAYEGGAILCNSSSPSITNCTFSGNSASEGSAALHLKGFSSPQIANSILWGDSPTELFKDGATETVVTYSNVQGGHTGTGNIDQNPLFFEPSTDDYRLRAGSPCVDQGDNGAGNIQPTDRDGSLRIVDEVIDMGAYELQTVTLDLTVRIGNKVGHTLNKVFNGQDIQMFAEFNNFNELEVPFERLLGRTLVLTFDPPGTPVGEPISISSKIVQEWEYLVGMSLLHRIPVNTEPGQFTLTGKLSISGIRCDSNENTVDSTVVKNQPLAFTYPFALPAASKTNPAAHAYRIIGVPVIPSPDDVFRTFRGFFGGTPDPYKWRMSAFDTATYTYREITSSGQDTIDYAKGWWIISTNAKRFQITGLPQRWDDGHVLYPGYQMIGSPFWDTSISWQDVRLHNPDIGSTSILYEWDGSGNYVSAESMSPGKAYWIWSPVFTLLSLKRDYGSGEIARTSEPPSRIIPLRAPAPPGAFAKVQAPAGSNRNVNMMEATKVLRQPPPPLPPGAHIQVLSPGARERVKRGKLYTIRWSSLGISPQGAGGTVKLSYSTNGGKTYRLIASRVKNTGSYTWRAPNKLSRRCIVRVTSSLYPSVGGTSKQVFTLY